MREPRDDDSRTRFLAACRKQPYRGTVPAWVMRQAGRYLPEYQALRKGRSFLETVRDPALAAEITCQPLRRFDMDAAVVFSDILIPPAAMGISVEFVEGHGPRLNPQVRDARSIAALSDFDPETDTAFLAETLGRVRQEIGPNKALIGFCGAPFTTASYLIEGGSSRNFEHSKAMIYGDPTLFAALCERLVDNLIPYVKMQVAAGADVIQVFDSWGGALDARTWREAVLPATARLVRATQETGVPVILYVNGASHLLEVMADSGADVLGIDHRVPPAEAIARVGGRVALQGNLDPCVLFAPQAVARAAAGVLEAFAPQEGYIFNLGTGILPKTPIESMEILFETLRSRAESPA